MGDSQKPHGGTSATTQAAPVSAETRGHATSGGRPEAPRPTGGLSANHPNPTRRTMLLVLVILGFSLSVILVSLFDRGEHEPADAGARDVALLDATHDAAPDSPDSTNIGDAQDPVPPRFSNFRVFGTVEDTDGRPVPDVRLVMRGPGCGAVTGRVGEFRIRCQILSQMPDLEHPVLLVEYHRRPCGRASIPIGRFSFIRINTHDGTCMVVTSGPANPPPPQPDRRDGGTDVAAALTDSSDVDAPAPACRWECTNHSLRLTSASTYTITASRFRPGHTDQFRLLTEPGGIVIDLLAGDRAATLTSDGSRRVFICSREVNTGGGCDLACSQTPSGAIFSISDQLAEFRLECH